MRGILILTVATVLLGSGSAIAQMEISLEEQQAELQRAVCLQDWDEAIIQTGRLMGRDDIPAGYREDLLSFRRDLEGYRSTNAVFDEIDGCAGFALLEEEPELEAENSAPLNWDWAVQTSRNSPSNPLRQSARTTSSSSSSPGSGNCDYPWQVDAAGNLCGRRAASERDGGR